MKHLSILENKFDFSDKNGIINVRSNTPMAGFYIVFKGSASLEKPGERGLSHLMEHLISIPFDKHYEQCQRFGVNYNAYTSSDRVVFYITGLDKYVDHFKHKLLETIQTFTVPEKEYENEKKVVLEEYDMFTDARTDVHFLNLYRKLFNVYSAIGLRQDIENCTYDQCKDLFKNRFSKPYQIINVSENYMFDGNYNMCADAPFEPIKLIDSNKDVVLEQYNNTGNQSSVIYISPMIDKEDIPTVEFIANVLGYDLKSPLMEEVRNKNGLVYNISCSLESINDDNANVIIATQTNRNNIKQLNKSIQKVFDDKTVITDDTVNNMLTCLHINKEKRGIFNFSNIDSYIYKNDLANQLDKINTKDCVKCYEKYFRLNNWKISVDDEDFQQEANESKIIKNKSGLINLNENKRIKLIKI